MEQVESLDDFRDLVEKTAEEYGYLDEGRDRSVALVDLVAREATGSELLDLSENYIDKWFSDYLYVKNLDADEAIFHAGLAQGEEGSLDVPVGKGQVACFNFGRHVPAEVFDIWRQDLVPGAPYAELGARERSFVDSAEPRVRHEAALLGWGLDKLVYDPDADVRWGVVCNGYGLDALVCDPDPEIAKRAGRCLGDKTVEQWAAEHPELSAPPSALDRAISYLEGEGFSIDGMHTLRATRRRHLFCDICTPEGEQLHLLIQAPPEADARDVAVLLAKEMRAKFEDFDVEEHVRELLNAKAQGLQGVPDQESLVTDALWIEENLHDWARELEAIASVGRPAAEKER